jgi:hypothetical protein
MMEACAACYFVAHGFSKICEETEFFLFTNHKHLVIWGELNADWPVSDLRAEFNPACILGQSSRASIKFYMVLGLDRCLLDFA